MISVDTSVDLSLDVRQGSYVFIVLVDNLTVQLSLIDHTLEVFIDYCILEQEYGSDGCYWVLEFHTVTTTTGMVVHLMVV